ncbi:MAG: RNA polymerase sigma factor [Saprospiraceae bacterium]|nr:RNA polymerase sigma factor [Saprospiraceae bacterium]
MQSLLDLDTIQAAIAGKRQAQEALYVQYSPTMFGICLRYASDYHSAEDILQEGFVKVFKNLDRFRGDGSFEGWMKRIFINTSIEFYRKAVNKRKIIEMDSVYDQGSAPLALDNLAAKDILKIIQKLPNGYRTIFNLYAIEGYTHREIGAMLGISEGTSKSQLARAREAIRMKIQTQNV